MSPRFLIAALAAALPALGAAQTVQVALPKALVFPNYDNVLVGKDQALEGGAYIARAADASANFYNPAGLVQSQKTSLNASSAGWVRTKLTSDALGTSVTSSKIDNVPGYFGAVIGSPVLSTDHVRLGVSLTRTAAWSPGPLDQTLTPPASATVSRITYSSMADFGTQMYQVAAAWAPVASHALRLGLSVAAANTSYSSAATLSGAVTSAGQPGQFLGTLRASGNEWDAVLGLGAQWDVLPELTVGAVVRSPGLRFGGGSLVTYESSVMQAQSPATSFFRDDAGRFEYRLPLEASAGIAYRFGAAQVEVDVRYHDSTGSYEFYRSDQPVTVLTSRQDGTVATTTQAAPVFTYAARSVVNASIGGNVKVTRQVTVHAGFYTSFSPVQDAQTAPLRKADLYGFTGGADLQLDHFGFSLGVGYQYGTSEPTPMQIAGEQVQGSGVSLQAISLLYAISYQF